MANPPPYLNPNVELALSWEIIRNQNSQVVVPNTLTIDERGEAISYSMTIEGATLPSFMNFDEGSLTFSATAETVGQWVLTLRATDTAGKYLELTIFIEGKG